MLLAGNGGQLTQRQRQRLRLGVGEGLGLARPIGRRERRLIRRKSDGQCLALGRWLALGLLGVVVETMPRLDCCALELPVSCLPHVATCNVESQRMQAKGKRTGRDFYLASAAKSAASWVSLAAVAVRLGACYLARCLPQTRPHTHAHAHFLRKLRATCDAVNRLAALSNSQLRLYELYQTMPA